MTTFDDRAKAYEDRFAHEGEMEFKVTARRNHLFGLWAAGRMHLAPENVVEYADSIVEMNVEKPDDDLLVQKVVDDFTKEDITIDAIAIGDMLEEFESAARLQVQGE